MLETIKEQCRPIVFAEPNDIKLDELLRFLGGYANHPLVFSYDGSPIKRGYHVTEVKVGRFDALDCGANPECWTEIFVQLWDVAEEHDRVHMPAGKFSAILRKVTEFLNLDQSAKLTFEVSDGIRPMQLYRAALPEITAGTIHIELSPRPASCKPRDRWLVEQQKQASCCGAVNEKLCCSD